MANPRWCRGRPSTSTTISTLIAQPHVLPGHPVQHVDDIDEFTVFGLRQLARRQLSERGDDRLHPALRTGQVCHDLLALLGGKIVNP